MQVNELEIPDVLHIVPRRFADLRGWFCVTWNADDYAAAGVDAEFCQDNQSFSGQRHTLRGLHFQAPPHAQAKLVRVVTGSVLDVVVDARRSSPSFGRWAAIRLTAECGGQVFIPKGFLHGFLTLEPDTQVVYKVDAPYAPECEGSVLWNDPDLAIDWGGPNVRPELSDKDRAASSWREFESPFA